MIIKICGVQDVKTAAAAVQAGADWIGVMLYAQSSRQVTVEKAAMIQAAVRAVGGQAVAVVVDCNAAAIQAICAATGIEWVQLHGNIARSAESELPAHLRRIYVVPVDPQGQMDSLAQSGLPGLNPQRDWIMYDSIQGGSGRSFPWSSLQPIEGWPFLVAGGLRVSNVSEAIQALHPQGIDVSSGVESQPAQKDINLINQFIQSVKGTI